MIRPTPSWPDRVRPSGLHDITSENDTADSSQALDEMGESAVTRSPSSPTVPDTSEELVLLSTSHRRIAGVDEVGRGCIAGPVVAAAVLLPVRVLVNPTRLEGVRDSKELTPSARERLLVEILAVDSEVGVGWMPAEVIDAIGIRAATRLAMQAALAELCEPPDALLIDYERLPFYPRPQVSLVHGDARSLSIAAASIVAKTFRDRMLADVLHPTYPAYGFHLHKGYGTAHHLAALRQHGPCPEHRRSFAPVRELLEVLGDE